MPNKDTAIAAEYTLEPAAYRKKARASVVASGAAASTQEIEVLQGKLRRRAEALIDHFIDSKASCVLNCSFLSLSLSSFPSLAACEPPAFRALVTTEPSLPTHRSYDKTRMIPSIQCQCGTLLLDHKSGRQARPTYIASSVKHYAARTLHLRARTNNKQWL